MTIITIALLASVTGYLVFGVRTQPNNSPSKVAADGAENNSDFATNFNSVSLSGFLDTARTPSSSPRIRSPQ